MEILHRRVPDLVGYWANHGKNAFRILDGSSLEFFAGFAMLRVVSRADCGNGLLKRIVADRC